MWLWIGLGAMTVLVLLAATVLITVAATSGSKSTASQPAAPIPFTQRTATMPDYRGWTMQGAVNDLNTLGLNMGLTNPASANSIVTSQTPAPGTTISASTTGIQLFAGAAPTAPAAPSPDTNTFTAGTYEVGTEIQPGTYKTPGASYCYYARLKNADNELGSIIANDIVQGQGTMTVKSSDKYIEFSGSCTWTKQ